jgi:FAD/FMN-containing dehydrogenase
MTGPALVDAGPELLARLGQALGPDAVRAPEPRHLEEPRGRRAGRVAAALLPADVEAVARAVRLCAEARVGVVPFGGGTGLVGGHTPTEGALPVLLSLERLRRVREIDLGAGIVVAEAGVPLAEVQAAAREAGRLFPLSLASEGTASVGGVLATNAGGVHVLRYGNARDLCLGVEAVMADGRVLNGLSRVLKDNLGYDLRHLLIGSEGTLGVITAASLRLHPLPAETVAAWVATPGPAAALDLLARLRGRLGQAVSAFELMHRRGFDFMRVTLPAAPPPPVPPGLWTVLVDAADGAGAEIGPRLEAALAEAVDAGAATDALVAQSEAQRRAFWALREAIPEANRRIGSVSSHDMSLPPSRLAEFVERADAAMAALDPSLRVNCFGHLGDGNLHYNVFPAEGRGRRDYEALRPVIKATLHDLVHELGGSVAAEHGVGRLKTADLARYADPAKLAAMRAIKAALDPLGILNPGAVVPPG